MGSGRRKGLGGVRGKVEKGVKASEMECDGGERVGRARWEASIWVLRCLWSHRAVTGVCGGRRCLFVWAGRVGRRNVARTTTTIHLPHIPKELHQERIPIIERRSTDYEEGPQGLVPSTVSTKGPYLSCLGVVHHLKSQGNIVD